MKKSFILLLSLFMIGTMANAQSDKDVRVSWNFNGHSVSGIISGTNVPSNPFISITYYFPRDAYNGDYGGIDNPFPGYIGEYEYINTYTIGNNTTIDNAWEYVFPISFPGSHAVVSLTVHLTTGTYQTSFPVGFIF